MFPLEASKWGKEGKKKNGRGKSELLFCHRQRPVDACGEGNFLGGSARMDFPSAQAKPPPDGKIIFYPPGVKEITDKITNDEVVKRLKVGRASALGCFFFLPSWVGPASHRVAPAGWEL